MNSKIDSVAIECLNNEINEFEVRIKEVHVFSNTFKQRMKEIISIGIKKEKEFKKKDSSESRNYVHISGRSIRRSLLVAIIIMSILISSIATIANIKPKFYFIVKENIQNWIIQFGTNEEVASLNIKNNHYIPKLPKGYTITSKQADEISGQIIMEDGAHTIMLRQMQPENTTINKTAGEETKHILIDGSDVIVSRYEQDITFIFTTDKFAYILDGNCDYDTLYEMVCQIIGSNR